MNRFSKYRIVNAFVGVRIIERATDPNTANDYRKANDPNRAHFLKTPIIKYRVQIHKSFHGITYWKTLVKTTSYKIAKDAYDLMVNDGKIGF